MSALGAPPYCGPLASTPMEGVGGGAPAAAHDTKSSITTIGNNRLTLIAWSPAANASSELSPFELLALRGAALDYRSAIGTQRFPVGPVYSDSGRMSRLSPCCSMMCAHHPAMRPTAKIEVPRSAGIPRNVYVVAA